MINKLLFAQQVDILVRRFNKPMDGDILEMYWEELSEDLDDIQFKVACRMAFRHCEFFPTPQKLIDFGLGSSSGELQASIEWRVIHRAAFGDSNAIAEIPNLSYQAQTALEIMGGLRVLGMSEESQEPWKKKEFIKLYGELSMFQDRAKLERKERELRIGAKTNGLAKLAELIPIATAGDETSGW